MNKQYSGGMIIITLLLMLLILPVQGAELLKISYNNQYKQDLTTYSCSRGQCYMFLYHPHSYIYRTFYNGACLKKICFV